MNIRLIIVSLLIILIIYFYLKKIKIEHATNMGLSTEAYNSIVSIFTNENIKLSNINILKINSEDAEFSGNLKSNNLLINNNAIINGDIYGNLIGLRGMIVMWSGNIDSIPLGWALCDGNTYTYNSKSIKTPDLRSRFILGATRFTSSGLITPPIPNILTPRDMDISGGEQTVQLGLTNIPSHNHTQTLGCNGSWCGTVNPTISTERQTINLDKMKAPYLNTLSSTLVGGDPNDSNRTVPHNNMPPFFALAFIMKL
jgi:microcystin-dependent protein